LVFSRFALRVFNNVGRDLSEIDDRFILGFFRAILTSTIRATSDTNDVDWVNLAIAASTETRNYTEVVRGSLNDLAPDLDIEISKAPPLAQATIARGTAANTAAAAVLAVFAEKSMLQNITNSIEFAFDSLPDYYLDELVLAFEEDFRLMDSANPLSAVIAQPIWLDFKNQDLIAQQHNNICAFLKDDAKWTFWHNWFASMWNGTFDDWEFAFEVFQISGEIWSDGAKAVADEIERIQAKLFFKNSPQIETVFKDFDGLYDIKSGIVDLSTLIDSVLSSLKFSYDLAIGSNHCNLSPMNVAAQAIRHVLENCRDDPNSLEQYLRNARSLIQRGIDNHEPTETDELRLLLSTLDERTLQLRSDHPQIADAVEARTRQRLKEIDDKKRIEIAFNMDAMRQGTALRLGEEFRIDSIITRDGSDLKATAEAIQRSGHRAGKINLAEQAKKAEGSGVMSGLKIGLRAKTLYDAALELMAGIPM